MRRNLLLRFATAPACAVVGASAALLAFVLASPLLPTALSGQGPTTLGSAWAVARDLLFGGFLCGGLSYVVVGATRRSRVAAGVARRGFLLGAAAYLAADCLSDYVSLAAGRGNWAAIASVDSVLWSLLVPFAVAGTATAVIEPSRTGFLRSVYVALAASVMVYLILGAAQAAWALVGLTSVLHEPSGALTRVDPRSPIAFAALSWLTADIGIGAVLGYLFAQSRSLIRGPGFRVLEPGCRERFWEVARAGSRVGAANEGEMHIRGREIAGVEVEVTVSGHQCVVVASSASSARVNGAAFSVAYLRPGDVLTIGSTQLVFELPDWRRLIGLDRVGGFWGGGC